MRNPLVSVEHLADALADAGESSPTIVLADVRWTLNGPPGRPDYEAGHLPGAVYVDLESELTTHGPVGGRHPLPDREVLQRAVRRIGVSAETPVVVYDGATSLAASRLWWLLTDAGHPDVRVLDGGFAAWQSAGKPVETGSGRTPAAGDFVVQPGHRTALDAVAVVALTRSGTGPRLVDVRAADRYAGQNETVDPIAGHIPGAVNRPSTENLTGSGRFRAAAEIAQRYADLPGEPVLYCGSGITAAHTLLALETVGRTGAIYPGSWSDWITDPDRPRATGPTP
ncbi:MAG TPA: sulfurtransferase [Microlunatus sp.]|nr:sulfurtransferase [Microlunatus sp.]